MGLWHNLPENNDLAILNAYLRVRSGIFRLFTSETIVNNSELTTHALRYVIFIIKLTTLY